MRLTLLSFLLLLAGFQVLAQTTITSAYFPVAGDTLKMKADTSPDAGILPQGTGQQTWDFSALSVASPTLLDTISAASDGEHFDLFPEAEIMRRRLGVELYYNVTADRQELIGYAGLDPAGVGLFVNAHYDMPDLYRMAPLDLFTQINNTSSVSFAADASQLPDSILNQLPLQPDSLKVTINKTQTGVVDAYGQMQIPGETYDVLRLNMTEYRNTQIFAKIGLVWIDVTSAIQSSFPNLKGIGLDTLKHYDFYSEGVKEPVAVLNMDIASGAVDNVLFKDEGVIIGLNDPIEDHRELTVSPNPAINEAYFKINQLPAGNYKLQVLNIVGAVIARHPFSASGGSGIVTLDVSGWARGTYLVSVVDPSNRTIATTKLIVVKP